MDVTRIRSCHGFSLVELLVVMAVISLLASMLLPALERGLHEARLVGCVNNLRQIGTGISYYTHENGDMIPTQNLTMFTYRFFECRYTTGGAAGAFGLGYLMYKGYLPGFSVYHCPEDAAPEGGTSFSYMYNPYGGWKAYNSNAAYFAAVHPTFRKLEQIPAKRPVTMDRPCVFNTGNSTYRWHDARWCRQFADGHIDSHYSSTAASDMILYENLGQWINGGERVFFAVTEKNAWNGATYLHGENPCYCGKP